MPLSSDADVAPGSSPSYSCALKFHAPLRVVGLVEFLFPINEDSCCAAPLFKEY